MAQNTTITIPANAWTEITDANVTAITFQNTGSSFALVKGTTGAAPTDNLGAIRYNPGQGERNVTMADLFPGATLNRVWVYAESPVKFMVSHA